jgi:hypothetical protein
MSGRGALSHRRAARQLIRSTAVGWSVAACYMTIRTRLETMANTVYSFSTPDTIVPWSTAIGMVVFSCAREVSIYQT